MEARPQTHRLSVALNEMLDEKLTIADSSTIAGTWRREGKEWLRKKRGKIQTKQKTKEKNKSKNSIQAKNLLQVQGEEPQFSHRILLQAIKQGSTSVQPIRIRQKFW